MSEIKLMIQSTPNPNALKFVVNVPVKTEGNYTYKNAGECKHNSLAKSIFELDQAISEVYFFDNYVTVTQNGAADWDDLEEKIRGVMTEKMPDHDPNFKVEEVKVEDVPEIGSNDDPDIVRINAILDDTVRPALQMDGGDIQLIGYKNNRLKVFYQGACGSCPSAAMGTLQAIENILKDQFNPEIQVEMAE